MKKDQIIYIAPLRAASILGLVAALLGVVAVPLMFLLSQSELSLGMVFRW